MNNNLMVFEGLNVEVFEFEGKVLFNPRHVGEALGMSYRTVAEHVKEMNEIKKRVMRNSDCGSTALRTFNNRGETFITESGVYDLIFKSRKAEAIRFKDWVTDEVLPQIRQTGGYIPVKKEESDEEFLARALMVAQRTLAKKDQLIEQQQKTIEIQAPKVERYDEFIEADGTYTSETLGKKLGFKSARAFNLFLNENKLIFKRTAKGKWIPSAKLPQNTYKLVPFIKPTGEAIENLRFTPMMADYLKDMKLI